MVFHAFLNIVVDIETLELISWISMHTARGGGGEGGTSG